MKQAGSIEVRYYHQVRIEKGWMPVGVIEAGQDDFRPGQWKGFKFVYNDGELLCVLFPAVDGFPVASFDTMVLSQDVVQLSPYPGGSLCVFQVHHGPRSGATESPHEDTTEQPWTTLFFDDKGYVRSYGVVAVVETVDPDNEPPATVKHLCTTVECTYDSRDLLAEEITDEEPGRGVVGFAKRKHFYDNNGLEICTLTWSSSGCEAVVEERDELGYVTRTHMLHKDETGVYHYTVHSVVAGRMQSEQTTVDSVPDVFRPYYDGDKE